MRKVAEGRERITTSLTKPTGFDEGVGVLNIQLTALNATGNIVASDHLSKSGTKLGAIASDTVKDGNLGSENNYQVFAADNYEGLFSVFREYDAEGNIDPVGDVLFAAVGEKGATFYAYKRLGKKGEAPWAAGDTGFVYQCTSDTPQDPKERNQEIKQDIPLSVFKRRAFKVTA
jgi:hypothetical protein